MSHRVPAPSCPRVARRTRAAATVLALGVLFAPASGTARAASPPPPPAADAPDSPATGPAAPTVDNSFRWSVQPVGRPGSPGRSYLIHDIAPGQTVQDAVRITNYTEQPMTFTVYGTDAFTTADGSFSLLPAAREPADAGAWIAPAQRGVTVAPGEHADVPVTITVPADAEPGDHAAGVIASVATVQTDASGRLVQVDRRIAARAYLRVAGPVHPGVRIQDVRVTYDSPGNPFPGAPATVTYVVRNIGNARVSAQAEVTVEGPFGWTLGGPRRHTVAELLPGAELTLTERFEGVFPAGRLTASVTVHVGQAPQGAPVPALSMTRTSTVWAIPFIPVAVLAALIAALVAVAVLRRRAARRTSRTAEDASSDAEAASGDSGPGDAVSAGSVSAGSVSAGSVSADSASADSDRADSGSTDSGSTDSGSTDAGSTNSRPAHSGSANSGPADVGPPDPGPGLVRRADG